MAITLTPVVPSHTRLPFQSLDVYVAARELAARAHALPLADAELRDQLRRAGKSAFLNLAEGLPADSAGLRRRAFALSAGSLCEAAAALDLAAAIGLAEPAEAAALVALVAGVKRMLRRLWRTRPVSHQPIGEAQHLREAGLADLAGEGRDLDRGRRLDALGAGDGEGASLVGATDPARALGAVERGALRGAQRLIAEVGGADGAGPDGEEEVAGDGEGDALVVGKAGRRKSGMRFSTASPSLARDPP